MDRRHDPMLSWRPSRTSPTIRARNTQRTLRTVLLMTHFPTALMGCESPLMRGHPWLRDASGFCERDDGGLIPVGSAGRRIAAKLTLLQLIVKGETVEQRQRLYGFSTHIQLQRVALKLNIPIIINIWVTVSKHTDGLVFKENSSLFRDLGYRYECVFIKIHTNIISVWGDLRNQITFFK